MKQLFPSSYIKERVKGFFFLFFIFIVYLFICCFKQVESNYGQKEPCQQDFSWIKFSLCLNFGYREYDIFQFELKMPVHATCTKIKFVK